MTLKPGKMQQAIDFYKVCTNYDPVMAVISLTAWARYAPMHLNEKKNTVI